MKVVLQENHSLGNYRTVLVENTASILKDITGAED
jgi:hypothetical protein